MSISEKNHIAEKTKETELTNNLLR